mmetsp:Transcript_32218/g.54327  ORF Transcript_32218/g.54327 Transcript_32218/m.54327 type:complete len:85 (-) Transcript_32218:61-315(-)
MVPTLMLLVDSPAAVSVIISTFMPPRPSAIAIHRFPPAVLPLLRAFATNEILRTLVFLVDSPTAVSNIFNTSMLPRPIAIVTHG